MSGREQGWSEPTPQELSAAIEAYDHVVAGGRPRSPIENGLRIARVVARTNGMTEDPEARPRTIAALARIVQVDRDEPKARVNSLMAARMVMTDLSIQRDAAIAHDLDVLDARDWWSSQELAARRPEWTAVPLLSTQMATLRKDPASIEVLARAEFHLLPPDQSALLRTSMEGLRSSTKSYRIDLDIDIASAAGLIPSERAERLRTLMPDADGRGSLMSETHAATRKAVSRDRIDFPEPYGTDRESSSQSSAINFRQRMNISKGTSAPVVVTDEHRRTARLAVLDSRFSTPETSEGRALKASLSVLRDLDLPESLLEGPAFERTVAHSIARTTNHVTGESIPYLAAFEITSATIVRNHAVEIARIEDSRFRGASEETLDRNHLKEASRLAHENTRVMLTQADRDLPDVRLIADGRMEEVGDSTGIGSHLRNAVAEAAFGGPMHERLSKRLAEIPDAGSIEPAPIRFPGFGGLTKGPRESGADWIAMMSEKARGRNSL